MDVRWGNILKFRFFFVVPISQKDSFLKHKSTTNLNKTMDELK